MTEPSRPAPRPAQPASTPGPPARWIRLVALGGPLAVVAVLGVFYAMGSFGGATPAACKNSAATADRLAPLVHGEVAALSLAKQGRLAPALDFKDATGAPKSLADFKGRTVLLNLWATWCIPCRQEMPALDRLQAKLGGDGFQVVAVNIDTARLERPKQFLADAGVTALPLYTDSSATAFQVLRQQGTALGLPTTVLVDPAGCEVGSVAGPAAWDSPDAERLIEAITAEHPPRTPS